MHITDGNRLGASLSVVSFVLRVISDYRLRLKGSICRITYSCYRPVGHFSEHKKTMASIHRQAQRNECLGMLAINHDEEKRASKISEGNRCHFHTFHRKYSTCSRGQRPFLRWGSGYWWGWMCLLIRNSLPIYVLRDILRCSPLWARGSMMQFVSAHANDRWH